MKSIQAQLLITLNLGLSSNGLDRAYRIRVNCFQVYCVLFSIIIIFFFLIHFVLQFFFSFDYIKSYRIRYMCLLLLLYFNNMVYWPLQSYILLKRYSVSISFFYIYFYFYSRMLFKNFSNCCFLYHAVGFFFLPRLFQCN